MYQHNPNATINIYLFDIILSKLSEWAAELIVSRHELNNWYAIKNILLTRFSDQRSIHPRSYKYKNFQNESTFQFGMRIQDSRSFLFSKLNSGADNQQTKLIKI